MSIGGLDILKELDVRRNQLSSLPSEIGSIKTLKYLYIHRNQLTNLPIGIGNLDSLLEINLEKNQITSLPEDFVNLRSLEELDIDKNLLTSLPDDIGNLTKLKYLFAEENQLTSLPSSFANLSNLVFVYMAGNEINSLPSNIGNLSSLRDFDLSYNQLRNFPSKIAGLISLEYLDLTQNQVSTLPNFTNQSDISQIELYSDYNLINLNDIAANLTGLNTHEFRYFVYMPQDTITGEARTVAITVDASVKLQAFSNHHPQSYYLWQRLHGNAWVPVTQEMQDSTFTIANVAFADSGQYRCRITNLWIQETGQPVVQYSAPITLEVEAKPLDPQTQALHDFVSSMANSEALPASWDLTQPIDTWEGITVEGGTVEEGGLVTEIVLKEANVQGNLPPSFENLTGLETLDLTSTGLTGSIPPEVGSLTGLTTLKLGSNKLSGPIPTSFSGLTQLQNLDLNKNETLSGPLPDMSAMTNLKILNLANNQLDGPLPDYLDKLENLQTIRLSYNHLSGPLPDNLFRIPALEKLYLNNNQLTDSIPTPDLVDILKPGEIRPLTELDLSHNQLIGEISNTLQRLLLLDKLYLNDNQLTQMLNLAEHFNAANLDIQVERNYLPLADIAQQHNEAGEHPFKRFTHQPQLQVGEPTQKRAVENRFTRLLPPEEAVDHPDHQYQWQRKEGGNWVDVAGATEASFRAALRTTADNVGEYRRRTTNARVGEGAEELGAPVSVTVAPFEHYVRSYAPRTTITNPNELTLNSPVGQVSISTNYLDGQNRVVQTVIKGGSSEGQDLVQFNGYDALGRPYKQYLPYAATGATGAYRDEALQKQQQFYRQGPDNVAHSQYAFAEMKYEASPLGRVIEQGAPGQDWQLGSGHTPTMTYRTNTAADNIPMLLMDGTVSNLGSYDPKTLAVSKTTDENGHYVEAYSNRQGQAILKRVEGSAGNLDTYSVYNRRGQLCMTVPPEAVKQLGGVWGKLNDATFQKQWLFVYEYDKMQRMSAEHVPGGGTTRMIYDRWGRLVLSQTPALREQNANQWAYTKYDYLDRPIMTGIYISANTESTLRSQALAATTRFESVNTGTIGYTLSNSFPAVSDAATLRSATYYDDYDFPHANESDLASGVSHRTNMKGEVTGSLTRDLESNDWLASVIYYDERYRPIVAVTENHLGGIDRITTQYESAVLDEVVSTTTTHTTAGNSEHTIQEAFDYDYQSRLTKVTHQVDAESAIVLSQHRYNALGQLVEKDLHVQGEEARQTLNYGYHIRGWLSKINDTEQVAGDYFAQELRYAQGGQNSRQYNGNISEVRWVNAQGGLQSYRYGYDKADRLTEALHRYSTGVNQWQQGAYSTKQISYDGNGNILGLQRFTQGETETKLLDFLAYSYQGNHLVKVKERGAGDKTQGFVDGANLEEEYFYDQTGNLIQDENKGLRNISYDPLLNLPLVVTTDAGSIYYRYDAAGNKLQQRVEPMEGEVITTDYVGAFEYENNTLALLHHAEGRVLYRHSGQSGSGEPKSPASMPQAIYHFDLKDHLGNIRTTFSSQMSTTIAIATMEEGNAEQEEALFENLDRHPSVMHNTTPGAESNQVAALNAMVGKLIGPARSMRVQPGEKVRLSVKARYEEFSESSIEGAEGSLAALLSAFGPTTIGLEGSQSYQAISEALGSTALMGKDETGVPHAYLNYLLFDDNFQLQDMGFQHMSEEGRVAESSLDAVETVSLKEIEISESGYLYTWVSNESNWDVTVYFDDFRIEHDSYIVNSQDYYAFGAVHGAERRSVGLSNKYQYQGKEWQADLGLDLLNFHARQYDPYLCRFTSIDPKAAVMAGVSPYAGMLNDPVYYTDPDGECPICVPIIIGMVVNVAIQGASGNINSFGDFALAAGIGAASGAAGFGAGSLVSGALGVTGSATIGGGIAIGAAGGFAGGFVGGAGNAWANGASFGQGLEAGALSGGIGAVTGGALGGIQGGIAQANMQKSMLSYEYLRDVKTGSLHYLSGKGGASTHFIHTGTWTDGGSAFLTTGSVQIIQGVSPALPSMLGAVSGGFVGGGGSSGGGGASGSWNTSAEVRPTFRTEVKSAFGLPNNLKYDQRQIFNKWRKHVIQQNDFSGYMSRKNYLNLARNIYNNPNSSVIKYHSNYRLYPGETHFKYNGYLLRLDPYGGFRSLYPAP